jgi:hypothetical protein
MRYRTFSVHPKKADQWATLDLVTSSRLISTPHSTSVSSVARLHLTAV